MAHAGVSSVQQTPAQQLQQQQNSSWSMSATNQVSDVLRMLKGAE
jgi:hypothetical protein